MQTAKMELQSAAAAATQTAVATKKQKPTQSAKPAAKPAARPAVTLESYEAEGQENEEDAEEEVTAEMETESDGLATLSEASDAAADTGKLTNCCHQLQLCMSAIYTQRNCNLD